jgi:hypothetical protein
VGAALAAEFAPGNSLILTGRNAQRLAEASERCRKAGALDAISVQADLADGAERLLGAIGGAAVDLVIDAASAASGARDGVIEPVQFPGYLAADVGSKIELLEGLMGRQPEAPAVIFVSTVLSLVRSPGRAVYTSLKRLHEAYLRKAVARRPGMRLLVVYVATVIDPRSGSSKAARLAGAVGRAFRAGRSRMLFGLSGRLLLGLYHLQPALFLLATYAQRKLRRASS